MTGSDYLRATFGLEGRVALVTGAREGIGRATALALAGAGARVAVTSRSRQGLESVLEEIHAAGSEGLAVALELRDLDQVQAAVDTTARHFGGLDILVNNAGIAVRRESLGFTPEDYAEVTEVNLRGSFFAAQAAARWMIERGGGRIVNLSSVFAHISMPTRAVYGASKAGVEQMTRMLALEWAPHRINVNCVAPATIDTPTRAHLFPTPEARAERVRMIPAGRLGVPEDVAPAVLYLVSPAAAWVTGTTILIDGGMSLD